MARRPPPADALPWRVGGNSKQLLGAMRHQRPPLLPHRHGQPAQLLCTQSPLLAEHVELLAPGRAAGPDRPSLGPRIRALGRGRSSAVAAAA
eukprot:CAMPEP_0196784490 /NCGR_PEP_ID=MMETSP1104-20130614/17073_1 /TAXON_ID=33652 /ORGANISM="Cafeteria sp., Strain Caron Lab Isolate" /LENGTH=91 /DNA_ID=CAMNT_0042154775 /DNA_START=33 /DNA_END=304 /DNA_ORIENTATION=+